MSETMTAPAVRTPQKSHRSLSDVPRPRAAKLLPESGSFRIPQNDEEKAAFLALIDEARIRAGMTPKEMAINAGVPQGQFSEAMRGVRGNFAAHWLNRQPPSFWLAWHKITAERYGLSPQHAHDIYAEQIGQLVTLLLKHRGVE